MLMQSRDLAPPRSIYVPDDPFGHMIVQRGSTTEAPVPVGPQLWQASSVAELWMNIQTPNRRPLQVLLDAPLVIGRDCDGLILMDQRVSRRHTSLEPVDGRVRVTDLGSSNGTTLNGIRLTGPAIAGPGDAVAIGSTTITFQQAGDGNQAGQSFVTELTTPPIASVKTSIELVAESVTQDADLGATAQVVGVQNEPGTLTIVFSDIERSTELAVAMGDTDWFAVLGRHHRLVTAHVDAHQGRIVKHQGDGYMLCFRSANQALLASIGLQRDLARLGPSLLPAPERLAGESEADSPTIERPLRVRIGAHTGEVLMQDDGDLFGKHVIVAARVGALATGGQILVSSLLKQIAEPRGVVSFGPSTEVDLKGIDGTSVIHEVDWAGFVDHT